MSAVWTAAWGAERTRKWGDRTWLCLWTENKTGAKMWLSWCPLGVLLVSSWCPPGVLLVSSWCPPGLLVVHYTVDWPSHSSRCWEAVTLTLKGGLGRERERQRDYTISHWIKSSSKSQGLGLRPTTTGENLLPLLQAAPVSVFLLRVFVHVGGFLFVSSPAAALSDGGCVSMHTDVWWLAGCLPHSVFKIAVLWSWSLIWNINLDKTFFIEVEYFVAIRPILTRVKGMI